MSIRKEILVNTYPERYGLSLFIDNQQLYMESGKIRYYNDKLFKVIPVSIADINANGYSLVDGSGAYVENENVYKAFPFDDNVIDKDTRYQFKYDLKTLYYVIDDIRNNKRYIDVEFEKVKVLDAQDNDVTENFEPMFIIQNKEVRAFAGYLTSDNAIPIIENLDDDGFLNNFYILAEFKMPQQEVIDLNPDLSIYDYAEYKQIDFLDGSMFVDNGDGFLSTDNEIKLGLLDQSGQAQNTNLSFYVFIKGFLNIWDDPEKFGTIYIDQPQPEEAITAKYQTEPVGYYDGNSYLLQDVLIESKVNSQGQQEFDYYVSDYYPKFIDTVPEVIDARNIYDRKQSGDQEVLVLKKQFNSLGERLDSTYQEIELLKRQVNTDLPTSIVNSTQQLYGDIAQLENSIDDSISQMEQSVNSILSYAEIFQKMGEVLKRPTLTLFKTIQPHVVARNNLNIEYQTLADRLNAIDKDIYTNVFNIRDVFNRLEVVENIFSETPYNENIFITRDIEESGQLDLQQQLSEIRHITIEYAENQSNDIIALQAFDFSNYFWVVGARGQVSDGVNYITVENSNKILYKDIPLGLEVEYTINNVPIMKYDSSEELPGFRKFISNTNEIVSQSNSSQDRIDIIFEDPVYLNYDGISEEHDQQYDQRPFVAGDFWVNNLSYMDMDQEKQYLQNPNITTIEFYPNSNNVGNDPYMKSNGRYVSYSIFMGSYIPTVQNLNVTQQELYEIFQNNDFVYTFEIQQDKNAKKYNVRFHYLLKKFEISGEASLQDTNFLRILYRNRKIKGYINKQTYENSVNSSWNDILLGNTNTITVDGVYDEYGNYYPSATFYVLRTVRYRANKLQENDNRGILEFEGDFRYKLRKDRFRINVVNGERVEYYNVNDIRQSYLQPSQIEVQIQNNSIIMPHYNIYQGALNAQQVRSYFEIAKRLHIYRDALNTLSPIKSFYDELIQSGDNGGYNINVNGIIQADVISSIDKRLTDFIGEYADINNTVFGTLLFVDNTHIDFGQDTKNLGEAVFGLRFGDDNTTLYLDDSDIFYDGQLFHITQRKIGRAHV